MAIVPTRLPDAPLSNLPVRIPIAHRTQSRAPAAPLALFTKEIGGFAFLCKALNEVDSPNACSVLDSATGEFLEHPQLRRDPRYKETWDKSYANELGRLCQGIGTGTKPGTKRIDGTNTFFPIKYEDIPTHKQKEICHTFVICEVRPEKDDPDRTRITIGGSKICYEFNPGFATSRLDRCPYRRVVPLKFDLT